MNAGVGGAVLVMLLALLFVGMAGGFAGVVFVVSWMLVLFAMMLFWRQRESI